MQRFVRPVAVALSMAVIAAACGDDDEAASAGPSTTASTTVASETTPPTPEETLPMESNVTVVLVDHPMYYTDVLAPDQELLDELASEYAAANDDPQMERFLFGSMPITVFDRILEGVDDDERRSLYWLLWLSGYFGGRWLRGQIAEAQPDAPLVGFSSPPTEESFQVTMEDAAARLSALGGDDAATVAAAREALFDKPPPAEGEDPVPGLTDSFGYNRGYLLEILATPPEGVEASPEYDITCDGLFDCTYVTARLAALDDLADVQAAINADPPLQPELVAELLPIQEAAEPRGRGVWSGGLSVQGFSQASYDQLLDVSSSFLETVQATALAAVEAVDTDDAELARAAVIGDAAQIVWLSGYIAGLTNGEGEIELPAFAES